MTTETLLGAAVALFAVAAALAVIYWPEPPAKPATPDPSALTAERVRMQQAASRIAVAEGLPDGMTPALTGLADRLALDVHEGRRTPASAMQHMTATCRQWTRTMREAGAA